MNLKQLLLNTLPPWGEGGKGMTTRQLCISFPEIVMREINLTLEDLTKEGRIEMVSCGSDPVKYRRVKKA